MLFLYLPLSFNWYCPGSSMGRSGYLSLRVRSLLILIGNSLFSSFLLYNLLGGLHHILIPVPSQLFLRTLGNIVFLTPLHFCPQRYTILIDNCYLNSKKRYSTVFQSDFLLFKCLFFSVNPLSVLLRIIECTTHDTLKASLQKFCTSKYGFPSLYQTLGHGLAN